MADSWQYNEVCFKAAHNSIDRDEQPVTKQLHHDRRWPYQASCRGLELDLYESSYLPMWAVAHSRYEVSTDREFTVFLRYLRSWSEMNPRHDVVTIHLDLKRRSRDRRTFARYLDGAIDEHLGRDQLFTPGQLLGGGRSLVAAAMEGGWPTLGELRGRYILCLSGDEPTKATYARGIGSRLCFADRRVRQGDRLPSLKEGNRVFFNFDARESWNWKERVEWFARQRGFITRAYDANNVAHWQRALSADTNIIATDMIRNHEWALVGNRPFRRIKRSNRPPKPVTRRRNPTGGVV